MTWGSTWSSHKTIQYEISCIPTTHCDSKYPWPTAALFQCLLQQVLIQSLMTPVSLSSQSDQGGFNKYTAHLGHFCCTRRDARLEILLHHHARPSSTKYHKFILTTANTHGMIQLVHFCFTAIAGREDTPWLYCAYLYHAIKQMYDLKFYLAITQDHPVRNIACLYSQPLFQCLVQEVLIRTLTTPMSPSTNRLHALTGDLVQTFRCNCHWTRACNSAVMEP